MVAYGRRGCSPGLRGWVGAAWSSLEPAAATKADVNLSSSLIGSSCPRTYLRHFSTDGSGVVPDKPVIKIPVPVQKRALALKEKQRRNAWRRNREGWVQYRKKSFLEMYSQYGIEINFEP